MYDNSREDFSDKFGALHFPDPTQRAGPSIDRAITLQELLRSFESMRLWGGIRPNLSLAKGNALYIVLNVPQREMIGDLDLANNLKTSAEQVLILCLLQNFHLSRD